MEQPGGQTLNGRAQISNGGPDTTAPPLATTLDAISVERIGDFCNLNPVQHFHGVIQFDPNLALLSKYLIQSSP